MLIRILHTLLGFKPMHTKDKLAQALEEANCGAMATLAREGFYHDFLSPLAAPATQLMADLRAMNTPASMALCLRVQSGDFDATDEEAQEWANQPENKRVIDWLAGTTGRRPPDL